MAAELRWIIAALSVALLLGIWWWGARRSRQAPGNAALREPTVSFPNPPRPANNGGADEWCVSPLDPLKIRTAEFDEVHMVGMPMSAHPLTEVVEASVAPAEGGATEAGAVLETGTESATFEPAILEPAILEHASVEPAQAVPETHHIVTIRVTADESQRWRGTELLSALERHGLSFGRYRVFHRRHTDGKTLFCAASLVEPGTFDLVSMPREEFRGLSLFAVLPGPSDSMRTLDALIGTAADLAATLGGSVQDAQGLPLTLERAMKIREDVARRT